MLMHKASDGPTVFKFRAGILACALACVTPAFASDFEREDKEYEPPVIASCSLYQGVLISADDDCLLIGGTVRYRGGLATDSEYLADYNAWVRATAVNGNANAVVRLSKPYGIWQYDGSIEFVPGRFTIDEAYVAYGGDSFVVGGQVTKSIANMADDQPLNYLGTFYAETDGLGWSYAEDRSMVALQAMGDLGNGWSAGVGIEDIDTVGLAVGVVNYSDEDNSGHLTIIGPDLKGNDSIAIHTGITLGSERGTARAAYARQSGGAWSTLVSGELSLTPVTLAGSVETGSSYGGASTMYWGFGASASLDLNQQVTASVGARWADEDVDVDATETWQYAFELAADLAETLRMVGEVGVHRTNKAVPINTISYAGAKLRWKPGGQTEMWTKYEINALGSYRLIFLAEKTF